MPKPAAVAKATSSAALELAMQQGDEDAFGVFADRLIEKGDPRGELIQLQRTGGKRAASAAAALLKKHAGTLVGPFATHAKGLTWKRGFVERVVIRDATAATIRALLDHPSGKFVAELEIQVAHRVAPQVILELASRKLPTVRSLELVQGYADRIDPDPAFPTYDTWDDHQHKRGDALWKALPNLETLTLTGFNVFHSITHTKLKKLVIEGLAFCDDGKWQLPELERLSWSIECDDTGTGVDFPTCVLAPMWSRPLPKLRYLDLSGCGSIGYMDVEGMEGMEPEEMEEIENDAFAWAIRFHPEFHKLAKPLAELVLPNQHWKTKKQIATWLGECVPC